MVEANASDGNTDCAKPSLVLQQVNDQGKEKAMSHDYAHLGPMPTATPSGICELINRFFFKDCRIIVQNLDTFSF